MRMKSSMISCDNTCYHNLKTSWLIDFFGEKKQMFSITSGKIVSYKGENAGLRIISIDDTGQQRDLYLAMVTRTNPWNFDS